MGNKFKYLKPSSILSLCFLFCIIACMVSCKTDSGISIDPQQGVAGIWKIKSWIVTPAISGTSDYLKDEDPTCWKNVRYQFYEDGNVILRAPKECDDTDFEDDQFSSTYWKVRGNKLIIYYEQDKIDDGDEYVLEVNSKEMSLTSQTNSIDSTAGQFKIKEHILVQKFERL